MFCSTLASGFQSIRKRMHGDSPVPENVQRPGDGMPQNACQKENFRDLPFFLRCAQESRVSRTSFNDIGSNPPDWPSPESCSHAGFDVRVLQTGPLCNTHLSPPEYCGPPSKIRHPPDFAKNPVDCGNLAGLAPLRADVRFIAAIIRESL